MTYNEMVIFLKNNSIKSLSEKIDIPLSTLRRFLYKNGYEFSIVKRPQKVKRKRLNILDLYGNQIDSNLLIPNDMQKQIIYGTLFGDSGVYWSTKDYTAYFKCEHAWGQITYLKVKIELLKPFSFNPCIDKPCFQNQDYQVGFSCHASEFFAEYRRLLYTRFVSGLKEFQKDIIKPELWLEITPLALAFWAMDGGKKLGAGLGISIGKKEFFNRENIENCVESLNRNLSIDFSVKEEKLGFILNTKKNSKTVELIKDYVLPDFYYKIGLKPSDCGSWYNQFEWWNKWKNQRRFYTHPLIEKEPYSRENYEKMSIRKKELYKRALFRQIRTRWFPYVVLTEKERIKKFEKLRKYHKNIDEILSIASIHNTFVNSFMNHRYHLSVKNRPSPYEIFLNNKELKKVVEKQLKDGPSLNNSNIRAALSVYRTQVVGQFSTAISKILCDQYCPEKGVVLDPCSGFGARLTGVLASGRDYYGFEPADETFDALLKLKYWLEKNTNNSIDLYKKCFEDSDLKNNSFDMALTSPPYFDKEIYSYKKTQSIFRYENFEEWIDKFLSKLIYKTYQVLKVDSVFILNIDDIKGKDIINRVRDISFKVGFKEEKILWLSPRKRPGTLKFSSEPLFVLRKKR